LRQTILAGFCEKTNLPSAQKMHSKNHKKTRNKTQKRNETLKIKIAHPITG